MTEKSKAPQLPAFKEGEIKKLALGFKEVDGKIEITLTSRGMNDDINEMATFLAFSLEKMLESWYGLNIRRADNCSGRCLEMENDD